MSQSQLLIHTIKALEKVGCEYMLTGSLVSSMQGEPRATHDIDIVVEISQNEIEEFLKEFALNEFYYDLDYAKAAMKSGSMFNILSITSGDKIDIWALTKSEFDQSRFARKQKITLFDLQMQASSPEDTILMKLLWAQKSGGSEKQLFDAAKVYELQFDMLDKIYLESWVKKLGLEEQFSSMQRFLELP